MASGYLHSWNLKSSTVSYFDYYSNLIFSIYKTQNINFIMWLTFRKYAPHPAIQHTSHERIRPPSRDFSTISNQYIISAVKIKSIEIEAFLLWCLPNGTAARHPHILLQAIHVLRHTGNDFVANVWEMLLLRADVCSAFFSYTSHRVYIIFLVPF